MSIKDSYRKVLDRLREAAERSGQKLEDIRLICVTKEATVEKVREAVSAGVKEIGENRVQELLKKQDALKDSSLIWHFIGVLQTNKVKKVVGNVSLIQSLDRISLAQEIDKRASQKNLLQEVLVEVNISGEETKHGVSPDYLPHFLDKLENFPHLRVRGLMTIAPYIEPLETRPFFRKMRKLFEKERERRENFNILSMGMSNDFEVAVEEGSNMVRIGSAIFKGG
jgi:hypothetical protein